MRNGKIKKTVLHMSVLLTVIASLLFTGCLRTEAVDTPVKSAYAASTSTPAPNAKIISEIKTLKNGKRAIFVEGKPFQLYGTQIRVDTWRRYYGYTNEDITQRKVFEWAKKMNANVVQIPVSWAECEPLEGVFHWEDLDWAINECKKYGLKMEILWFGSDVCGSGWTGMTPYYVAYDTEKFQRVLDAKGNIVGEGFTFGFDGEKILLCREDPDLHQVERRVVSKLMSHLESYDKTNVVIGIQVENEPTIVQHGHPTMNQTDRCHCNTCNKLFNSGKYKSGLDFSKERLALYLNRVAGWFKESPRKMFTRVNFISVYEKIDESIELTRKLAPNIDFIGYDNYGQTQEDNYRRLTKDLSILGNIPHVCEQEGAATDCRQKIIDTFAANGCGNEIYRLEGTDGTDNYLIDFDGKDARYHTNEVRQTFGMLNKAMFYLATKKNGNTDEIRYFNCEGTTNYRRTVEKKLGNTTIKYKTEDAGIGIAFADNGYLTIMSAEPGSFTFKGKAPVSCEAGRYDRDGRWVREKSWKYTTNKDGTFSIDIPKYEVVRLKL